MKLFRSVVAGTTQDGYLGLLFILCVPFAACCLEASLAIVAPCIRALIAWITLRTVKADSQAGPFAIENVSADKSLLLGAVHRTFNDVVISHAPLTLPHQLP